MSFLLICCGISACKKDFLVRDNPNEIISSEFYQSEQDALQALNSVYAVLQHQDLFKEAYWFILDGMDDHRGWISLEDAVNDAMYLFNFTPQVARSNSMWDALYRGIFRANLVINRVGAMEDFALKNRILGEARFLRGWYYNELATMWGGVPIVLDEITVDSQYNFPKSSRQEVYAQAETDFKFAENNLPKKSEYSSSDAGRATSGAASAYLGKSFLFQKKWTPAIQQFEKVIASGEYKLMEKYAENFSEETENNAESVFEIQFSGDGTALWSDDQPASAEHNFLTVRYFYWRQTGGMLNFRRNQYFGPKWAGIGPRRMATFSSERGPGEGPRITKHVNTELVIRQKSDVNLRDMRYSDVLLMYAEALNENGQTSEAIVQIDLVIERVRKEFGLADASEWTGITELKTVAQLTGGDHSGWPLFLTGIDQDGIRNVIKHQRSIEFMHEWKRYKDLVRWGDAADAIVIEDDDGNETSPFVAGKHELFPIPQAEIDGNAGLTAADQNPGY
ncbi:MAG: RagB/SusD family nutrient uptake outer membrane protein [Flavobacteriaceae bacterium]|nr:RagB/SusD family nutrient uptake outer membrane protein [Flavobacteriaceae bacterium]